jgi:hypothetical protein
MLQNDNHSQTNLAQRAARWPRMLAYICMLLVLLIAIGPLMIVWPPTLFAQSCILARQAPCSQGGNQTRIPPNVPTPPFAHIVVVVEENHSFSEIVGNLQAPYINSLASAGVLLTNYHAVSHPSEPNYFALYAGSTFGVQDDGNYSEPDPTLATILQGNGESFIGYVESGSPRQHNPWESFPEGMSVERNMSTFPANDFSQLPDVSFVVPNLNDDMHDGTVAQADQWLSINIGAYAQWAVTHQSLLMVVWDEDDETEGNQVPAILYGANIVPGAYNDAYTHYNLLHTLLDASGLSAPRNAALVPAFGNGIFSLTTHALTDTHDFNGDGFSDILFRDSNSGTVADWLMNGANIRSAIAVGVLASNWFVVGTGDFNGDGTSDILLRDSNSNTVAIWQMSGGTIQAALSVGVLPGNWSIVGTGDFNGDGTADILLRDSNSNTVAIWEMNNNHVQAALAVGVLAGNWNIVGTGDFNGDGKTDILLQDSNSTTVAIWEMNGNQILAALAVSPLASNWKIVGTGDFNGDGTADILLRDTNSNTVAIWQMKTGAMQMAVSVGVLPGNWQIIETGDFNGDRTSDILLRDTNSNTVAVWEMNGNQILAALAVSVLAGNWQIQSLNTD